MSLHLDDDYDEPAPRHTELTLSTGTLVVASAGLVLLCALCFWLGYTMRGGSRGAVLPAAPIAEPSSPDTTFNSFKPAAGSPVNTGSTTTSTSASAVVTAATPHTTAPTPQPAPVATKPSPAATTSAPTLATTQSTNGYYVQVAAVSHQQDADKLVATLHAEGYLASSHTSPQDTFFRVQIGPYATRQDADLIRQKLAAEGYTPIVK